MFLRSRRAPPRRRARRGPAGSAARREHGQPAPEVERSGVGERRAPAGPRRRRRAPRSLRSRRPAARALARLGALGRLDEGAQAGGEGERLLAQGLAEVGDLLRVQPVARAERGRAGPRAPPPASGRRPGSGRRARAAAPRPARMSSCCSSRSSPATAWESLGGEREQPRRTPRAPAGELPSRSSSWAPAQQVRLCARGRWKLASWSSTSACSAQRSRLGVEPVERLERSSVLLRMASASLYASIAGRRRRPPRRPRPP